MFKAGKNRLASKGKKLAGSIDGLEAGKLTGWAALLEDEAPLEVCIYTSEGELLGKGLANEFRADLEEHGINAGYHAFSVEIDEDKLTPGTSVEIRVASSNEKIPTNEFTLPKLGQHFHADIINVEGNKLSYRLTSATEIGSQVIRFASEQGVFCEKAIESEHTEFFDYIWLPEDLLTDSKQKIVISVIGASTNAGVDYIQSSPILTPVQFLAHSASEPELLGKPGHAGYRYESLKLQMEALAKSGEVDEIRNLHVVHNAVVNAHEDMTSFSAFALPKVENPKVSIVVPAYNKFALTYRCIASIALSFNKTSYEVILADDCSEDVTSRAEDLIENLVISRNEENLRFLRSCNQAAKIAKGKYLVFLNNDTEVTSGWIDELVLQHEKDDQVVLTGSKLINENGSLQEAGGLIWGNGEPWNVGRNSNPWAPEWNYARDVDYVTGAAMCIRKNVWEEVGGFSDEFAPCYYEDADLAFKVREAGYRTMYVPHSVVIHLEGKSHGTDTTVGLKRYQKVNEATFRKKWFSAFKAKSKPSAERLHQEKDNNVDQRVLVIDYAVPMPNNDAGSYAAVKEIELMQALGFKVTFVPDNLAYMGKFTKNLQRMGVEVLAAPFYTSLFDVLERRLPEMDAVYITRYTVAEKYIDVIKESGKPVLFNNADLHFLREIRAALRSNDSDAIEAALVTQERELDVCRKADAILTYNSTEHAVIQSHTLEQHNMHITPWVLEEKVPGPDFYAREGIAFLGGFNHLPNVESVEYLVKEIMPALHAERPDIVLYVYGSKMPAKFKNYECDNIKMVGFAESLDDVFHKHKVFVAPLLSGAGIKGKVLESMAYGLPSVLTEVAAEGTGLASGISTQIAESSHEWVTAIQELYDNEEKWVQYSSNAMSLVSERYSFEHGKKVFKEIFASVGLYTTQ
ncbi:glycosyltransferase [Alteromonas sp. ASW11-19]|uniref:Glycosyltransferase n=1 Tax=Alteromonas salexigens TaxID=2982530 RepID=A0ABT2VM90_9ALTE|nr:glycosyltransferase [Alteromonas salexigens]MCU7554436.1 glycosyltransferase [Alteromonas salexigens]